jgi:5-methylthioadenosine/S-adenosylhomocysteine deaminase
MRLTRRELLKGSVVLSANAALSGSTGSLAHAGRGSGSQLANVNSQDRIFRGTICTLDDANTVYLDGLLWISGNTIRSVVPSIEALPAVARKLPVIATEGVFYPGLIDLHKHMTYDIRGPWFAPRQYTNRTEFFFEPDYRRTVENPCRLLVQYAGMLDDVCLYSEIKALAGGTTALEGAAPWSRKYTSLLVRNIEFDNFGQDRIHQTIWDVTVESAPPLRELMPRLDAWIYHLSEGYGDYGQQRFSDLKQFQLLTNKLVAIHALGLNERQFAELAAAGASMVWSPLGNLRLYGRTADIAAARRTGVNICLGSEWAPSGSKNVLFDLKVADQFNQHRLNGLFADRDLVEMVTRNAARAVGWKQRTGHLAPEMAADLLLLRKTHRDPYRNLIDATEQDVELVMVGGVPVYGGVNLMRRFDQTSMEILRPGRGSPKALAWNAASPASDHPSYASITSRLSAALRMDSPTLLASLDRLQVRRALSSTPPPVQQEYPFFLTIGDEPLTPEEVSQFLTKVFPEGVAPFDLDPVYLADDPEALRVMQEPVLLQNGINLAPYFESILPSTTSTRSGRSS